MSQFVNTNDLQQAIDEISNNSVPPKPEVDAIKDQMGVPPVPPVYNEPAPAAPVAPAPEVPAAPVAPVAPVVESASAPAKALAATGDLGAIKTEALRELVPLMDHVNLPAEQKFGIVTDVIAATGDKSIASSALEAARGIADENLKAESLLKLVQIIDN